MVVSSIARAGRAPRLLFLVGMLLGAALASRAAAQGGLGLSGNAAEGEAATEDEYAAFIALATEQFIRAREEASAVLGKHPDSFVARYVLGMVERQAEGNFPRAVFELTKARAAYEKRFGKQESPTAGRWYRRILLGLADSEGDLDHYETQIALMQEYDRLFDPDLATFRAWPLMKLRRFGEARRLAAAGVASGEHHQVSYGLNALCAIEFEAGNIVASYEACTKALEYGRSAGGATSVDLANFAEASRSVFKLDEAERVSLEASRAEVSWYGNPYIDLADLYTRGARFAEALGALKKEPEYRLLKPPHARDADRNEARRALAAFYVVVGFAEEALRITEKAIVSPDRRAHQSRDPAQDELLTALVDRAARRLYAEQLEEEAASSPLWRRPVLHARALLERLRGWQSGRQAARLLAEGTRLRGAFQIGTKEAAIMPPWLAPDLVEVVGPGIVGAAVAEARRRDARPGADAYYDAVEAEVARARGDDARALRLAERVAEALGPGEELLRARMMAAAAISARALGETDKARRFYAAALDKDPGIFRRLGEPVPVVMSVAGSALAEEVSSALLASPRFVEEPGGLALRVAADGSACLVAGGASTLGCAGRAEAQADELARTQEQREARVFTGTAGRIAAAFLSRVFAPRIDLSHSDAQSLDGSTGVSRSPMDLRP